MIGQNFFNYVDFMINKILLFINQAGKLSSSELINIGGLDFYSVRSTTWACNYRERPNNIAIDNKFISTVKERDQRWSEWKYGLPVGEIDGLTYIPREQPDLKYLGKTFSYNPRNKVFFIPSSVGQDITKMAREFIEINNFNRESLLAGNLLRNIENSLFNSSELQSYFIFKKNKFIPLLSYNFKSFFVSGRYYREFELKIKNKEFYTEDDIQLSRNFKFPKLKWGSNNEFLLYYDIFKDPTLKNDYKYINPSFLVAKVNTPRLFSNYDPNINGNYTEPIIEYPILDLNSNKVMTKSIDTNLKTINSCYITSDDNTKIFEIVVSRLFFIFRYHKSKDTMTWQVSTKLNNKFADSRDKTIRPNYTKEDSLNNLQPSRFNLQFTRIEKQYLNSLAIMEHSPDSSAISYIEPFIYQPGTLPASNKWQPDSLEQIGGYPKGIKPTSVEINNGVVEYKFDFDIKESGGNFKKLPNPENESKFNFKNKNLVPTSELIL